MKTRILCCLLLFLSISIQLFAQKTITGQVVDLDEKVISGAKISIKELNLTAFSDANGVFKLENVPNKMLLLTCEKESYQPFQKEIAENEKFLSVQLLWLDNKNDKSDNTKQMEEVFVTSTRANKNSGTTYTQLSKEQIAAQNYGQDLPYLLEATPSTVITSDAGAGVGYTGVRIRGVDPTRTNVTINGIPINDAESHAVYWVNMPDFASSVENIQIQRGVGTSSNGAASFGASINVQSEKVNKNPYAELSNSYGSFNTWKNTIKAGTGLLQNKYAFDVRLSRINSDGFIDRATADLKSYFASGTYLGKKATIKANVFSGKEITYQAWYGVPEAKLYGNMDSLNNHFYANYYPGGIYQSVKDSTNLYQANNRTYNYYQYENEVDNYQQTHYQLLYSYSFNNKWKANLAGHLTHGEGYYEQFRQNDDFQTYGLTPIDNGLGQINSTDLIRRRWLNNNFYGGVYSLEYDNLKDIAIIFGGAINQYDGQHYGEIIWARYASQSEINDNYYDNKATKKDVNAYLKINKKIGKFNALLDLQVRTISYSYLGVDESDGNLVEADQKVNFSFFNPKVGLTYNFNAQSQVYTSFSVANREPVRDDFRENLASKRPKHETLQNLEVGYRLDKKSYFIHANYYLMYYYNQLILTGEINDVGGYTRTNVDNSYRSGIELEAGKYLWKNSIEIKGNASFSQNKIVNFDEFIDDYDNGGQVRVNHRNTDLAFSPNMIIGLSLGVEPLKDFKVSLMSKYVGKQYLDNTATDSRSLDAYYITNLTLNYSIKNKIGKEIMFGLLVNNLFNHTYENNGYTWGYLYGGKRTVENFYFPQAGSNFLGKISIIF